MEDERLRQLIAQIGDLALDDKKFMHIYKGVSDVLSYLKSEQDKRATLSREMETTRLAMTELKNRVDAAEKANIHRDEKLNTMAERSERNGKLLMGILTAVLGGLALQLLHFK